jgi:hypothetical protein
MKNFAISGFKESLNITSFLSFSIDFLQENYREQEWQQNP